VQDLVNAKPQECTPSGVGSVCATMAMPLHVMQYCYVMQLHMHFKDFKLSLFTGLLLELVTLRQHAQYAAAADHKGVVSNACCVSLA